ncbi:MAG: hypothetical protein DMG45_07515 [Acidobacteria bacterium]|nr:MAG: hypothetical protein DMG47_14395 [Acidobacteriota bacterium]PYT43267.1 MAG: hypothetical protein DMG45_07515 [Acidobacteriota bacterium]PYT52929.1 MAG: hypothetical protein DMG46_25760 [Acidobacteriota bacterium]
MTHTSEGIATDDNIFARRTTNLRISSTEATESTEITEKKAETVRRDRFTLVVGARFSASRP